MNIQRDLLPKISARHPAARPYGALLWGLRRSHWLVLGGLAVTTALWGAARLADLTTSAFWFWRGPSQLVMWWSATAAILSILSVVRANAMAPMFGDLGEAVRLHRQLGLGALLLLALHVALLAADAAMHGVPVASVLVPFWSSEQRSADILVFYGLLILGALAYEPHMSHERWRVLHRLIGLLFLGGTIHSAFEPGTARQYEPLRIWLVMLVLAGICGWLYSVLFLRFGPRYRYQVVSLTPRGPRTIDLLMRPVDRRMMYEPGTFVFLNIPSLAGFNNELHPFSISSSPVERDLRISIALVGDFTKQLKNLADSPQPLPAGNLPAMPHVTPIIVEVFGPFGGFTMQRFARFRRLVWIGAGIGITPFLSMLTFEKSNTDFRRIWLYYMVHGRDDAVYDAEITQLCMQADSLIDYQVWASGEQGRLTAARILEDIDLDDYAVMLCGTQEMTSNMARQFRALGLPPDRIILEELQFRPAPARRPGLRLRATP